MAITRQDDHTETEWPDDIADWGRANVQELRYFARALAALGTEAQMLNTDPNGNRISDNQKLYSTQLNSIY